MAAVPAAGLGALLSSLGSSVASSGFGQAAETGAGSALGTGMMQNMMGGKSGSGTPSSLPQAPPPPQLNHTGTMAPVQVQMPAPGSAVHPMASIGNAGSPSFAQLLQMISSMKG